jgi:selenocysteine lyase/cysteine desulfurase
VRESEIAGEFPLEQGLVHLNHAAIGPWPRRTRDAVAAFAEENSRSGSVEFPRWDTAFRDARRRAATLLGCPSESLSLLKNTSEGLSQVAFGLDWRQGDNVVFAREEFLSNRMVWQALSRLGVEAREVATPPDGMLESALEAACDGKTRLIAVSSVQYATGLRIDLEGLASFCRSRGILLAVDAIQGLGALRMDLSEAPVDFLASGSHKWLLSPEGVGLFYCRPERREILRLNEYGWAMIENDFDFEAREWTLANDGRRFECGSPNRLGVLAVDASLSLLLELGPAAIEQRVLDRARYLASILDRLPGLERASPRDPARDSGIVAFRVPGDPTALADELIRRRILCAARGGLLRFSPHFYTPFEQLDRAVAELRALL